MTSPLWLKSSWFVLTAATTRTFISTLFAFMIGLLGPGNQTTAFKQRARQKRKHWKFVLAGRATWCEWKLHHSFELARMLVRFDHIARVIVNANHGIVRPAEKLCIAHSHCILIQVTKNDSGSRSVWIMMATAHSLWYESPAWTETSFT